jgi:hypothetical protein
MEIIGKLRTPRGSDIDIDPDPAECIDTASLTDHKIWKVIAVPEDERRNGVSRYQDIGSLRLHDLLRP